SPAPPSSCSARLRPNVSVMLLRKPPHARASSATGKSRARTSAERFARDIEVLLIAAQTFAPLTFVEARLAPRVRVLAELVLRIVREEGAHALLRDRRELEAETVVDLADRRDGVGHELGELRVDDLIRRDRSVFARGHRTVEPVDDVLAELRGRTRDRRVVA